MWFACWQAEMERQTAWAIHLAQQAKAEAATMFQELQASFHHQVGVAAVAIQHITHAHKHNPVPSSSWHP